MHLKGQTGSGFSDRFDIRRDPTTHRPASREGGFARIAGNFRLCHCWKTPWTHNYSGLRAGFRFSAKVASIASSSTITKLDLLRVLILPMLATSFFRIQCTVHLSVCNSRFGPSGSLSVKRIGNRIGLTTLLCLISNSLRYTVQPVSSVHSFGSCALFGQHASYVLVGELSFAACIEVLLALSQLEA